MYTYSDFKIIHSLASMKKKISDSRLKTGDRFLYGSNKSLLFKTDVDPQNGKYLCCDEAGNTKWIHEEEEVIKINGIAMELVHFSSEFKNHYLKQLKSKSK